MDRSQIAVQLYSFRDYIKTSAGLRDTLNQLAAMGYKAVQLSGAIASTMPRDELHGILKETGMRASTCHYDSKAIVEDTEKVIDRLQEIGCNHLAYPYPHWMPSGKGEVLAYAADLEQAAAKFLKAGIVLSYHNHAQEFVRFEKRSMLELIYENAPSLQGEIDTYWVQCGGENPVKWIEKLAGRQDVIHFKDYGMQRSGGGWGHGMAAIGKGNLDWKAIIAAGDAAGVKLYVVEHDGEIANHFEVFAQSMSFICQHFTD